MRSAILKRVTSGLLAGMLLLTNVLLPAQPAFASGPRSGGSGNSSEHDNHENSSCHQDNDNNGRNLYSKESASFYSNGKTNNHDDRDDCEEPPESVKVPSTPAVKCGDDGLEWVKPADTEKVKWAYAQNGDLVATTKSGYEFEGGHTRKNYGKASAQGDESECGPEKVTIPQSPEAVDLCGLNNAYWDVDALNAMGYEHVTFKLNNDNELVAKADEGYVFAENDERTYNYGIAVDSGKLCEATSVEPKFVDRCGTANDYYIVKDTENVEYYNGDTLLVAGEKNYVTDASEVTITAKVTNPDYEITNPTPYTYTFTNKACHAKVELEAKAWCVGVDTKVKAVLTNNTNSWQAYEVVVTDENGVEVTSWTAQVGAGQTSPRSQIVAGDGEYTLSVYSYNHEKRGNKLLAEQIVMTECEDTFTPEIYKKNQDGAVLNTGTFTVTICQWYELYAISQTTEDPGKCKTKENVMFGTGGTWFANNVDYVANVPTQVTITETEAPVGCTPAAIPWVFEWGYNREEYNLLNSNYLPSGSWNTTDGSNVFNLYNNCDEPGKGGETPTPTPTVTTTVTPVETLAETGDNENAILVVAGSMLLASIGLALSPRFRHNEI